MARKWEEIEEAVREEMRPGGRPVSRYFDLKADQVGTEAQLIGMTNELIRNLEERLVALEQQGVKLG